MASPTRWTWVWVNSGSWWWTGRLGVLQFIEWQRVRHNWATELNWTEDLAGERKEAEHDIGLRVDPKGAVGQIIPSFVRRGTRIQTVRSKFKLLSLYLCLILLTFSIGSSVQLLSCVDTLQPHGLKHSRLPCPSPTPGAFSNSSNRVHQVGDTIQPSHPLVPYSSWPQSFSASGSFQMSQFFVSGGQVLEFQL